MPTVLHSPLPRGERLLSGLAVLLILVTFFATVVAVNVVMAYLAITTLGGVRTPSAYKAGLNFAADVAAAERQSKLHWQIDGHLEEQGRSVVISVEPKGGSVSPRGPVIYLGKL